jgi:hypothetical protein
MEYAEEERRAILVTPDAQSTEPAVVGRSCRFVKSRIDEKGSVYVEGAIAGIIGASVIALWFLVLDIVQGRPFHTPTVLGTALFAARDAISSGEHLHPFRATVMYTWFHGLVFVAVGVIASWLLGVVEKKPDLGFGVLLLFVFFEILFVASTFIFADLSLSARLAAVLFGNLLAAAISSYLWYRHKILP